MRRRRILRQAECLVSIWTSARTEHLQVPGRIIIQAVAIALWKASIPPVPEYTRRAAFHCSREGETRAGGRRRKHSAEGSMKVPRRGAVRGRRGSCRLWCNNGSGHFCSAHLTSTYVRTCQLLRACERSSTSGLTCPGQADEYISQHSLFVRLAKSRPVVLGYSCMCVGWQCATIQAMDGRQCSASCSSWLMVFALNSATFGPRSEIFLVNVRIAGFMSIKIYYSLHTTHICSTAFE